MKHKLTIEHRLTGASKALAKLERMGPRYRGLVAGMKRNIRNLEEYRARGFEFMPYKDRETYLRKQREFYQRRKAKRLIYVNPNESPPAKGVQETRVNSPVSLRKESANSDTMQGLKAERFQPRVNPVQLREPVAALLNPERRVQADQKARSTRPVGPPLQPPWPLGVQASKVCPYCRNTGESSPGTSCTYCLRG